MGYYAFFLIQHRQLKKEMKAYIRSEAGTKDIQMLIIPIDQYKETVEFIEESEFRYKGELFDLIKKETSGNQITLYCINDKREKSLIDAAREHQSRNNEQNNSSNKSSSVIKNIIKEACPESNSQQFCSYLTIRNYFELSEAILDTFLPKHTQPPKS